MLPRRLLALVAVPSLAALTLSGLSASSSGSTGPTGSDDDRARVNRLAKVNGLDLAQMQALLQDPTVRLTRQGRAYVVDPAAPGRVGPPVSARAVAPVRQTFRLHSNPGAKRTIFLDFDGTKVSDTAWNRQVGVRNGEHRGWDPANNGGKFSNGEKRTVQSVWARVSEDYAPFGVDVTTEQPRDDRIHRSSKRDKVFGTRVLISESDNAHAKICDRQCGGVSFINVFSSVGKAHRRHQPAWVFPAGLTNDTKAVAEAATHEAGHTFGLVHDGGLLSGYYEGHGAWAPIMGAAYFRPITQWSRGSYVGATSHQDDVAIISQRGAPFRRDEAGSKIRSAARRLPAGTAYISRHQDVDVYRLGRCSGRLTVRAMVAKISPNLDIRLRLFRNGHVIESADPPSARVNRDRANGLSAAIRKRAGAGTYYAAIEGVGRGDASSSYNDYGSLGAYRLTVRGC